jgi:hypothetical protein
MLYPVELGLRGVCKPDDGHAAPVRRRTWRANHHAGKLPRKQGGPAIDVTFGLTFGLEL